MNRYLAEKINKMAEIDQKYRQKTSKGGKWDFEIDKKNTAEMKKIVEQFGWPTIPLVGKKASHNAWLLVQHADLDRKFQKQVLKMIKSVEKKTPGLVQLSDIAYLTDRILVAENKKQEFGTQFFGSKETDWKYQLRPIRAMKNLDIRRNKYGMPPVKHTVELMAKNSVAIQHRT